MRVLMIIRNAAKRKSRHVVLLVQLTIKILVVLLRYTVERKVKTKMVNKSLLLVQKEWKMKEKPNQHP
jgi:hypothetical protein